MMYLIITNIMSYLDPDNNNAVTPQPRICDVAIVSNQAFDTTKQSPSTSSPADNLVPSHQCYRVTRAYKTIRAHHSDLVNYICLLLMTVLTIVTRPIYMVFAELYPTSLTLQGPLLCKTTPTATISHKNRYSCIRLFCAMCHQLSKILMHTNLY